MRRKAHTALTSPLVLHHTRINKRAMKKSFSMAKCGINICKLRNGVKKTPQFLLFSMAKGGPSAQ
jgi:hypothetical protein